MSNVYFMSDLHLFHENICRFRPFQTVPEHDLLIQTNILECSGKRNTLYLAGDTFLVNNEEEAKEALKIIETWNKYFDKVYYCLGNHCVDRSIRWALTKQLPNVFGLLKYKEFWISHAPVHPLELRGKANIHGHCVDEQTEILTKQGWKTYNTISVNDEIYSYNPLTKFLEDDVINNIIIHPEYSGGVYSLEGKGISMRLTDKHRVPFSTSNIPYLVEPADKAFSRNSLTIFKAGRYLPKNTGINLSHDLLRLYIALAADGNITNTNLCRFHFFKERKIVKLKLLLERLEITYTQNIHDNKSTVISFLLPAEFKDWNIKGLDNKLLSASRVQCEIIRETYQWTDGNRNIIYSSKLEEIELLQHLFVINGYSCKKYSREDHGFSTGLSYQLSVTNKSEQLMTNVNKRVKYEIVEKELFWCVQTNNQNFIARRNGSVYITGNCHSNSIIHEHTGKLDPRYFNVCCENVGYKPIELKEIREQLLDA